MDEVVVSVRGYVESGRSADWFELVGATYDECAGDWPAMRNALPAHVADRGFDPAAAEVFAFAVDGSPDPAGLLAWLSEHRAALPDHYAGLVADDVAETDTAGSGAGVEPTLEQLEEWRNEEPAGYHWFPGEGGAEGAWRVWHAGAVRFVTEAEWTEMATEPELPAAHEPHLPAEPELPAEISEEVVSTVMGPAIANALEAMAADGEFSEEDIADVLNRAQSQITSAI